MRAQARSILVAAAAMAAMASPSAPMSQDPFASDGRPDYGKPTRPKKRGTFKQKARQQIRANAKKRARR